MGGRRFDLRLDGFGSEKISLLFFFVIAFGLRGGRAAVRSFSFAVSFLGLRGPRCMEVEFGSCIYRAWIVTQVVWSVDE